MWCTKARPFQFIGLISEKRIRRASYNCRLCYAGYLPLTGQRFCKDRLFSLSLLMVSTVSYPKIRNIKILAFVAAVFGVTVLLYFMNMVEYMRIFSIVPFILMLTYLFSPFFRIPLLSNLNSKEYRDKGLKIGGRKEKN